MMSIFMSTCKNLIVSIHKKYDQFHIHSLNELCLGKNFMKKCKLSPDAYIQMALQLAHYRVRISETDDRM